MEYQETGDGTWRDELRDLPDAMHTTPELAEALSGRGRVRRMLDFEVALARVQARHGLFEPAIAEEIAQGAGRVDVDVAALSEHGAVAGTIAVPVVAALRAAVSEVARRFVHLGGTSQDVIDTAMALQMRDALVHVRRDLVAAGRAAAVLAARHRLTPLVGRTLLQQASPVSFGLKVAGWLAGITRQVAAIDRLHEDVLVLQFGGSVGTLSSLGEHAPAIADDLAAELGLASPGIPWHTERSRIGELAGTLATTSGVLAKIATDVVLLMQNEVAEAAERSGAGKGSSSALPNKANPVDTMAVLAGDRQAQALASALLAAMPQPHERGVGEWQAEWTLVPQCARLVGASAARTATTLEELVVDPRRMAANLEAAQGFPLAEALTTALTPALGKADAHALVAELCTRAREDAAHVRDLAITDPRVRQVLDADAVGAVFEPANHLGSSGLFVDRAIAGFEAVVGAGASAG